MLTNDDLFALATVGVYFDLLAGLALFGAWLYKRFEWNATIQAGFLATAIVSASFGILFSLGVLVIGFAVAIR